MTVLSTLISSARREDELSPGAAVQPATENSALHLIRHFDFAVRSDLSGKSDTHDVLQARVAELEAALRQARERTDFILDSIADVHIVLDHQWRFLLVNGAALRAIGLSRRELLGRTLWEVYPGIVGDELETLARRIMDQRVPARLEFCYPGARSWWNARFFPLDGGLAVFASDITKRRRAEQEFKSSEERARNHSVHLQAILEAAPIIIWIAEDSECHSIIGNRIARELCRVDETTNMSLTADPERTSHFRFCKDGRELAPEEMPIRIVAKTGRELRDYTYELVLDDGTEHSLLGNIVPVFDAEGEPGGAIGAFVDVTNRKRNILILKESQERFRQITENIDQVFWMGDPEITEMLYISPAYEKIFGRSCQSLYERPRSWFDSIHPEDLPMVLRTLKERGTDDFKVEYRVVLADRSVRHLLVRGFPVRNESGEIYRFAGIAEDISEHKRIEKAMQDISAKLRKAQEISRIGSWEYDLATRKIELSDQVYRIMGMLPEKFDGNLETLASRVAHPVDMEAVRNYIQNVMTGNETSPIEFSAIGPDDAVLDVWLEAELIHDACGKAVRMVGTFQDTTARKQLQESLQKAKENERYRLHLDTILRSIGDGIVTVDAGMRVTYANEGLRSICPCLEEVQIGALLEEIPCLCGVSCFAALDRIVNTRNPVVDLRVKCREGNDLERIIILNGSQMLAHDNQFVGAVLTVKDVTRIEELERRLLERNSFRNMIGKSKKMLEIYSLIESLTDLETTVLITGESGTGKELIAEALHYGGIRSSWPLVKVNCSALPEGLLESELFGHVRGAFTSAVSNRVGRFQAAEGGTIFLDEIGVISPLMQIKLLRVLEHKEFEQVGDSKTQKAKVRVVAATNADLGEKVRRGFFREDLYYRLRVMVIHLPPLRERAEDIPLLTDYFIRQMRYVFVKNITGVSNEVMQVFMSYRWPGNIRELKHTLEHACILCPTSTIALEHLPKELSESALSRKSDVDVSAEQILTALRESGGKKAWAARALGISRRTLYRRIEQYKINDLIR
jgi:sigma-54 dependent transcriptional regulator, acetoin dehydrogenase operon transcriptional activator AcoR